HEFPAFRSASPLSRARCGTRTTGSHLGPGCRGDWTADRGDHALAGISPLHGARGAPSLPMARSSARRLHQARSSTGADALSQACTSMRIGRPWCQTRSCSMRPWFCAVAAVLLCGALLPAAAQQSSSTSIEKLLTDGWEVAGYISAWEN